MNKDTNFIGQPIFKQILFYISKADVQKIATENQADRYVKKMRTYDHLLIMLYGVFEGVSSLRELVIGFLGYATKIAHLAMSYMPKRSTLSDANKRRLSDVFGQIYMQIYKNHWHLLSDSRLTEIEIKRLYIIDSTTIRLFKAILKGVGRNPVNGKKKGGIKAHALIEVNENVPQLIRYSAAARHDRFFLEHIKLSKGSFITFDKAYNDYKQYARFGKEGVFFVTCIKKNAVYQYGTEFGTPTKIDDGIL